MDMYISGESVVKDKRKTAQTFLDTAALNMEDLKVKAIVKDATYYKFIATKSDGFIYDMQSSSLMGRTTADVAEYLKNPLNEELLKSLTTRVEKYWNQ
jgi:hypothetical protein